MVLERKSTVLPAFLIREFGVGGDRRVMSKPVPPCIITLMVSSNPISGCKVREFSLEFAGLELLL